MKRNHRESDAQIRDSGQKGQQTPPVQSEEQARVSRVRESMHKPEKWI